jgi:hypothetical protein
MAQGKNTGNIIYFARIGDEIKIGCCRDMKDRIRKLRYESGKIPEIIGVMDGDSAVEAKLHEEFKLHLVRGREWFAPAPRILLYIKVHTRRWKEQFHSYKLEPDANRRRKVRKTKPSHETTRATLLLSRFQDQNKPIHNRRSAMGHYAYLCQLEAIPVLEAFAESDPNIELVGWAMWHLDFLRKKYDIA